MVTITKIIEFDSAHRVLGHEGKCRHVHGHRYKLEVTVSSIGLDKLGRVIDFSVLKNKVKKYIDDLYDHNIIIFSEDKDLIKRMEGMDRLPVILPCNPTVENLIKYIGKDLEGMFNGKEITVRHLRLYETPTSYADYDVQN